MCVYDSLASLLFFFTFLSCHHHIGRSVLESSFRDILINKCMARSWAVKYIFDDIKELCNPVHGLLVKERAMHNIRKPNKENSVYYLVFRCNKF